MRNSSRTEVNSKNLLQRILWSSSNAGLNTAEPSSELSSTDADCNHASCDSTSITHKKEMSDENHQHKAEVSSNRICLTNEIKLQVCKYFSKKWFSYSNFCDCSAVIVVPFSREIPNNKNLLINSTRIVLFRAATNANAQQVETNGNAKLRAVQTLLKTEYQQMNLLALQSKHSKVVAIVVFVTQLGSRRDVLKVIVVSESVKDDQANSSILKIYFYWVTRLSIKCSALTQN